MLLLDSGSSKPSFTNVLETRSNSRTTFASAPPRESETSARDEPVGNTSAPPQNQFSFSAVASESRSSTDSQTGSALRYSASVVRRQSPRVCFASRQKL